MLACRITQCRKHLGLSQFQLAQQLHISPSTLGMYEQGRRTPSIDILVQLSKIFNVSLDYLITGSEYHSNPRETNRLPVLPLYPCCKCLHCKIDSTVI